MLFFCQVLQYSRTIVLLKKLKPLKKTLFQKRRWSCDFPPRKTPVAQKYRAISRQEKMAFSSPPSGCLGTLLPLPQSLCGRTDGRTCLPTYVTMTSQPKFLGSIGYQICLAMELRWRASSNRRVIFFLLYRQACFCTNNNVKAGNDVNDILTSENMENTSLESRM